MDTLFERPGGGNALSVTAHHESGHAVVAHRLRFRVIEAVVRPDGSGEVKYANTRRSEIVNRVIVDVGGYTAQTRFDPTHHSPTDRANARENAFLLSGSKRGVNLLLRWAQAEAEHLVKTEWPLIVIIASELEKHRRLSGRQVTRIVRRYDADKRAALAKIPNLEELLAARRKRLLRGRKPRRADVARAAVEAMAVKRFVPAAFYKAIADRMVARGADARRSRRWTRLMCSRRRLHERQRQQSSL